MGPLSSINGGGRLYPERQKFKAMKPGDLARWGRRAERLSKLCLGPQGLHAAAAVSNSCASAATSASPLPKCPPSSIRSSSNARHAANVISTLKAAGSAAVTQISVARVNPVCRLCVISTLKQFLLVSLTVATLLGILCANESPSARCRHLHDQLPLYKLRTKVGKELRSKYENLLKQQPWKNCSGPHLQPSWTLSNLMGWDKLEALETVVNLYTRVLQNCSQDMADKKIFEPVLETLIPLGHEFQACIRKKPAGRNESENLSTFKKEFQKFKASNAEQSPKCLEAAVGLDIHRLLKTDIKHPPRLMF
ncbi:uncharacterized protein LOC125435570 [Sphaerodactylus townsendi]|uniref:uncharacterized protein LOC125435570 n=1 Tax=Sphaerodactylus townsendi TaxID=933632 RepID=UPI002026284E|nr:uncharacterized protein LOC125435570 [Sphaerodactylus townsendi]